MKYFIFVLCFCSASAMCGDWSRIDEVDSFTDKERHELSNEVEDKVDYGFKCGTFMGMKFVNTFIHFKRAKHDNPIVDAGKLVIDYRVGKQKAFGYKPGGFGHAWRGDGGVGGAYYETENKLYTSKIISEKNVGQNILVSFWSEYGTIVFNYDVTPELVEQYKELEVICKKK